MPMPIATMCFSLGFGFVIGSVIHNLRTGRFDAVDTLHLIGLSLMTGAYIVARVSGG